MTSILKKYLILTLHGNFSVIPLALMMCLSTFSEASGVNSISESSLEIPPCSIAVAGTDPPVISCGNPPGTVALMATSYGLYSNLKHYWYTAAVGGSELDGSPVTTIKTPGYDAYYSTINVSNVTSTVSYWVATCVDGDRDEVKITVNPSPIVDINTNGVTPYNVCPGSGFTISCTTSSSSYQWYKDGTAILNATAADYMPEVDGNYKVKIIDATCGELPSSIIPVTIVDYTATPIINPVGLQIIANSIGTQSISVNLTGTGYTYQWKKDGVDIAGETNATYIANSDGSYTVDVWYGGCLKTSQALNLHINLLPIAIAGIDIALVLPDELNVTLDGSSSYDPDGTIASYSWSEVSNKNVIIDASNTATPRLSNFTGEGIYEFSLTVTDDLGESASDNIIITASIIPNNYNWVKETVVLTKDVKNEADLTANAKSIKWDYFDGLGRPMQSVSVENSRTGKDIITPIVYDEFGRQSLNYLPFVSTAEDGLYKTNAIDPVTYTSSD